MSVWLLTDRPDHPVLHQVIDLLSRSTDVLVVDPAASSEIERARAILDVAPPDVVLLKSHDEPAIALGRHAAAHGVLVLNDPDATALSLDRDVSARIAESAGLPFPRTSRPFRLGDVDGTARGMQDLGLPAFPILVKSRRSRRGDMVALVDGPHRLAELAGARPGEEVVVQRAEPFDGWDHKVWVVGEHAFSAVRRSPLLSADPDGAEPDGLPEGWPDLVRAVGSAYGLVVYGVDVVMGPSGPLVVDVNPFPGCRDVDGPAAAIAALALTRAAPGDVRVG